MIDENSKRNPKQSGFVNEEIRGKLTIYKEGEVLVDADVTDAGTIFKYEVRKQKDATFAVYAGAEIKSAGGRVIYKKGDLVKDKLVTGDDVSVTLDNLFLGTYAVKETGAPKNFVLNGESKDVRRSRRHWARKPLTYTTHPIPAGRAGPTASITRRPGRNCYNCS